MIEKTVLVIEDDRKLLAEIMIALRTAGFKVIGAATVAEARAAAAALGETIDVVILDMRLDDPEAPDVNGAMLGIEIRSSRSYPPEFMINSAYGEADYYRLALELGAAVYLRKVSSVQALVQHTQVLALRRALSVNRPNADHRLQLLAETSRAPLEAVSRFCREIVNPVLAGTISCPYLLLLTSDSNTEACSANGTSLALGSNDIYHRIQALTFADVAREPVEISAAALSIGGEHTDLSAVDGAWSLALADTRGLRLTLVLLPRRSTAAIFDDDPGALSIVMSRYFRSAVLELLMRIVATWTILDGRRRAAIDAIADFCDRVGEEQDEILSAAFDNGEIQQDRATPNMSRLSDLGRDLRTASNILHTLVERSGPVAVAARTPDSKVSAAALVKGAWENVIDETGFDQRELLRVEGDLSLDAAAADLQGAIADLLQWFASRAIEQPPDIGPSIRVQFIGSDAGPQLVFDDASRRLDAQLRKHMFQPFASPDLFMGRGTRLGLYLAKIEVEVGHQGRIEDRSDELPGNVGHRLVIRLPPAGTV